MPVIPDDTFTLSFLFLRYLFNTKWCISNVVERFRWILGAWELRDCVCCWFDRKPIIWSFVDFKSRRAVISGKGTRRGGPLVFVGSLWVMACMFPNHAPLADIRYRSICDSGTDLTSCAFCIFVVLLGSTVNGHYGNHRRDILWTICLEAHVSTDIVHGRATII